MSETGEVLQAAPERRRRGRPQHLPDDPIPLSSRTIGVEERIAWLLATSRILHHDEGVGHRDRFRTALAERGLAVDGSRISRWESAATPVPGAVIRAYEDVTGRPPGSLASVADGLRRAFGETEPKEQYDGSDRGGDLDELLDRALGGTATGDEWQRLCGQLAAYERVFLRQGDWEALSWVLIEELARSVGSAYLRRYEAAARLIRHPIGQRYLSRALGRFVMHPDSQVLLPVLTLLSEVGSPAAGDLVLRMMGEDNKSLRRAAACVASAKLRRGHLPESSLRQLSRYVAQTMRRAEPLDGGLDAVDLALNLPSRSFTELLADIPDRRVQAQLGRARSTGELLTRQQAAAVIADLAAVVQADETDHRRHPEPDMMLRRLLREALFHHHKQRRHHAAVVLAASPYRRAVSRQCHALVGGSNYFVAARAWALMMRVGHSGNRGDLVLRALSEPRPTLRSRALVNLGLYREPITPAEAGAVVASIGASARGSVRHGMLFALGMAGSPQLVELAASSAPEFSQPAAWWLALGPAIREEF